MSVKKWTTCAFLFFVCYLIIAYLDKAIEEFRGGGGGGYGGRGRGGYGRGGYGRGGYGRGYYGGRGYGRGYYGGSSYRVPVVVNEYPSYWYPYYLYPSYWSSYFY